MLDQLKQRAAELEADNRRLCQQLSSLQADNRELTDTLEAARAMNRELMAELNGQPQPGAQRSARTTPPRPEN